MIYCSDNGIPHFQFPNLSGLPGLRHGIFTRTGGVSQAPYESLNVGMGSGDRPEAVRENRDLISRSLGDLVFCKQVHGAEVLSISRNHDMTGYSEADAMVTDLPGRFLALKVADCQPVLLYDPVRRAVGAVHSGWRGSVQNIIGTTVRAMVDEFGCRPENMIAGIGPSLGPCCSEFVNYKTELPEPFWEYGTELNHFDFWSISRDQLVESGLTSDHVHIGGICTRCRTDLFFSYRGEKVTGRFAAVIGMEEK